MIRYRKTAIGGTFDRLHVGHEQLLRTGLSIADSIVVGVTRQSLVTEKVWSQLVQPFEARAQTVTGWLANQVRPDRFTVVAIDDMYGPTLTDETIDALVVTSQTRAGGGMVNQKRAALGKLPLPIIEAPMIADAEGVYVSSTRIRQGLISRAGSSYQQLFAQTIHFNPAQLASLSQLQGRLLDAAELSPQNLAQYPAVILVGDVVTQTFVSASLPFTYAIVDGKTKRSERLENIFKTIKLRGTNRSGTIDAGIASQLWPPVKTGRIFEVDGEEDLLAFVPLLSQPLHSAIIYGQPGQGAALLEATEANKLLYARYINPSFT